MTVGVIKLPAVLHDLPDVVGTKAQREALTEELANLAPLQERIGYTFARPALLRVALTVGSWSNEHPRSGWPSNGCLEFLGDAVLGLSVADGLWQRFPDIDEGKLTRLRASLVSERALASVAAKIDLGQWLYLGRGDLKQGGRQHASILADAVEAVLGAVFLDARENDQLPLEAAGAVVEELLHEVVDQLRPEHGLHPKSRLQQWAQAHFRLTPAYVRIGEPPPPGEPRWAARVELRHPGGERQVLGEGQGRSLREAERAAAEQALERVGAMEPASPTEAAGSDDGTAMVDGAAGPAK